ANPEEQARPNREVARLLRASRTERPPHNPTNICRCSRAVAGCGQRHLVLTCRIVGARSRGYNGQCQCGQRPRTRSQNLDTDRASATLPPSLGMVEIGFIRVFPLAAPQEAPGSSDVYLPSPAV